MGVFSSLKDKVLDKFGVLDDANDYFELVGQKVRKFKSRGNALRKVVESLRSDIESADESTDFQAGEYRRAKAIFRDLKQEMQALLRDVSRIERKGRKDKELWPKISKKILDSKSNLKGGLTKANNAQASLLLMEREHKTALKELERVSQENKNPVAVKRKAIAISSKVLGAIAGYLALVALATA